MFPDSCLTVWHSIVILVFMAAKYMLTSLNGKKSVHKYGVDILNEKIIRFDFGDDKDAETSKK